MPPLCNTLPTKLGSPFLTCTQPRKFVHCSNHSTSPQVLWQPYYFSSSSTYVRLLQVLLLRLIQWLLVVWCRQEVPATRDVEHWVNLYLWWKLQVASECKEKVCLDLGIVIIKLSQIKTFSTCKAIYLLFKRIWYAIYCKYTRGFDLLYMKNKYARIT